MKKKGLIISTVVMVVVLIASLTTATYAWFTSDGAASVSDIGFRVTASSDLVIGLSKTNTVLKTGVDNSKFVSDGTVFNAPTDDNKRGTWTTTSGGDGLGLQIDTGLQLTNVTHAVYSFTGTGGSDTNKWDGYRVDPYTRGTENVTTGMNIGNTVLKAKGNGSDINNDSRVKANMNGWGEGASAVTGDYLDVVFGVKPQKNDVKAYGCLITVTNNNGNNVGLSAALHAKWSTTGEANSYTEVDLYKNYTCGQAITGMAKPSNAELKIGEKTYTYVGQKENKQGDATYFIPLDAVDNFENSLGTTDSDIKQLHLIIYLCGPDGDCKSGYTANATITIQFVSINNSTKANGEA